MTNKMYLLFSLFLIFSIKGNAFNITALLNQFPAFSTFNNYLTQTQVASTINSRQGITVLAVDNDNISPLSGKPGDVIGKVMSLHVVIGYFDVQNLQKLPNRTTILTTLYHASGQATRKQGLLNATVLNTGSVVIGSAASSSTHGANLVKSILAEPYNISVLQVSTVIVPVGIDAAPSPWSATSPAPSLAPINNQTTPPTPAKSPSDPPTAASPAHAPATPPGPGSAPSDAPSGKAPGASPGSPPLAGGGSTDKPADAAPSLGTILQHSHSFSVVAVAVTVVQLLVAV